MTEYNYQSIVNSLWRFFGDKMSDWENGFIDNLISWKGEFTERQKEIILNINRKYRVKR